MSYCTTVTFKDQIHIFTSCHINQIALSYFLHRWISAVFITTTLVLFVPWRAERDTVGPGDCEDLNDAGVHGHEVNRSADPAAVRWHLEFLGLKDASTDAGKYQICAILQKLVKAIVVQSLKKYGFCAKTFLVLRKDTKYYAKNYNK